MRLEDIRWMTAAAVANSAAAEVAARKAAAQADLDAVRLRATGNGTLAAFLAPIALQAGRADRRHWWAYVGAHLAHARHLSNAVRQRRSLSRTSRYGGLVGYATVAALGAGGYAPGGPPPAEAGLLKLHRGGEQLLFGLYAFTVAHGYLAKGRSRAYVPLAALWLVAASRGRARWSARDASAARLR
jgi:hypothetical protein